MCSLYKCAQQRPHLYQALLCQAAVLSICSHVLSQFHVDSWRNIQLPSPLCLTPPAATPAGERAATSRPPFLDGELTFGPLGILWPRGLSQVTQGTAEVLPSLNMSSWGRVQ